MTVTVRFKNYEAAPAVIAKARALGLYGDTRARLTRIARRAAPYSNAGLNRRFHDFVLHAEGNQILEVRRLYPDC